MCQGVASGLWLDQCEPASGHTDVRAARVRVAARRDGPMLVVIQAIVPVSADVLLDTGAFYFRTVLCPECPHGNSLVECGKDS